jgi:hypothetical protein
MMTLGSITVKTWCFAALGVVRTFVGTWRHGSIRELRWKKILCPPKKRPPKRPTSVSAGAFVAILERQDSGTGDPGTASTSVVGERLRPAVFHHKPLHEIAMECRDDYVTARYSAVLATQNAFPRKRGWKRGTILQFTAKNWASETSLRTIDLERKSLCELVIDEHTIAASGPNWAIFLQLAKNT